MADFVPSGWRKGIGTSYVNVDRAVRLEPINGAQGSFRAIDADGEELGTVDYPFTQIALVPNLHAELSIVAFWMDEHRVEITRYPILGWRINSEGSAFDYATPITFEGLHEFVTWAIDTWSIRLTPRVRSQSLPRPSTRGSRSHAHRPSACYADHRNTLRDIA